MRNVVLLLLLQIFSGTAQAVVFKCTGPEGRIKYQDLPCQSVATQTELNCYESPLTHKALQQVERKLKQDRKKIAKLQKQQQRQKTKASRAAKKEQKQRLRFQDKCGKVRRKIRDLNEQYKIGYTIEQERVLKQKLNDLDQQRQKYCIYE